MSDSESADVLVAEAAAHLAARRYPLAEQSLRKALQLDPLHPEGLHKLGVIALSAGQPGDAEKLIRTSLQRAPDTAAAHVNLGVALNAQARYEEAIASYNAALALDASLESAMLNQAGPLQALGRVDEAVSTLERARDLNPQRAATFCNLGNLYKEQGRLAAALAAYDQALTLNPLFPEAFSNKLALLKLASHWSAEAIQAAHSLWSCWFETGRDDYRPLENSADPARRLRIGYVSPDCHTALPAFLLPVLRAHDPAQVELFAYFNHRKDAYAETLAAAGIVARVMGVLSDAEVAQQIRLDRIDILIDLAGHTGRNRLGVFARQPAPVQISWLDYLGSTGLEAMHYRLTDAMADPPGATEQLHSEALLRMPDTQWCWQPPADAPPVAGLPALRNGFLTFGSFNNYSKLTDVTLTAWRALLTAMPTARLLIAGAAEGSPRERVREKLGIAAAQLSFLPRLPEGDYRAAYSQVDIVLDPQPFSGATTTLDALWQGVPVLTERGPFSWSRSSASLLNSLGLHEWIVASASDLDQAGIEWAGRLDELAALRASLRDRVMTSAICNAPKFTAALEGHFRQVWRAWCESRSRPPAAVAPTFSQFDALFADVVARNRAGQFDESLAGALAAFDLRPTCKVLHAELAQAALGWSRLHPPAGPPAVPQAEPQRISFIICSIRPTQFAALIARLNELFVRQDVEIVGIHDAKSLCEGYNRGAAAARGEVLVFCHDDIDIVTPDFADRLLHHLSLQDLVGVAGTSHLVNGNWGHGGPQTVHGNVIHRPPGEAGFIYYASGLQDDAVTGIEALDGVFMACRREVWEAVRFDERTFDGFHLYDVDFSYRAHLEGLKVAVATDLLLTHFSMGGYDAAWQSYNLKFLKKFPDLSNAPSADRHCSLNVKLAALDQVIRVRDVLRHFRFGAMR